MGRQGIKSNHNYVNTNSWKSWKWGCQSGRKWETELRCYGERNDKTSDFTESVYKFMGSLIAIFICLLLIDWWWIWLCICVCMHAHTHAFACRGHNLTLGIFLYCSLSLFCTFGSFSHRCRVLWLCYSPVTLWRHLPFPLSCFPSPL